MASKHGIFCLESEWFPSMLQKNASVRPILEFINKFENIQYVYRDVGTTSDLIYYLDKWKMAKYNDFPILYLALHGEPDLVWVGDEKLGLEELADQLEGRCKDRVIVLGTCSTMGVDRRYIKRLLKRTNALAICGYSSTIDWVPSTALDMFLLHSLSMGHLTKHGLSVIKEKTEKIARATGELSYKMILKWEDK